MNKVHVKTGDTVMIISGRDRGKKGKVMQVSPKEGKVIIENANFVQKHVKPRRMGEPAASSRRRAPFTPARCRWSAPAAASRPAWATRSLRTAPKSAFAENAASRCKGGRRRIWQLD